MRTIERGPLSVVAAGGADREGRGDGPAIVLCHGFGAPGDDLVSLHRVVDVPPGTRWFFPAAPIELELGFGQTGRAWWNIDMMALQRAIARGETRMMRNETPDGLAEASTALRACLDALAKEDGLDPAKTILGGFSQGSMLATEITLMNDTRYAGLAVLSGALLSETRWREGAKTRAKGLAVMQSHGQMDPILPFGGAESLRDLLIEMGADVSFTPFRGQHAIPEQAFRALGQLARTKLV